MSKYDFYRTKFEGDTPHPTGEVVATLNLNPDRSADWDIRSKGFEVLALPILENPMERSDFGSMKKYEPYSTEAMDFLRTRLLKTGFFMVESET